LLASFHTSKEEGLNNAQVKERLAKEGRNQLIEDQPPSLLTLIGKQVNNALIYILLAAALISAVVGEISDAIIIGLVILINTTVGVIQESKAENSLIALRSMTTPKAVVRRNGIVQEIAAEELVRGDIVYLEAGRIVPADIRLIETANLQVEESSLTGESISVDKDANFSAREDIPLGDQKNMEFMTTLKNYRRGIGIVYSTGMATDEGKLTYLFMTQVLCISNL